LIVMNASVTQSSRQREVNPVDGQLTLGPMGLQASQSPIKSLDSPLIVGALIEAIDNTMSRKEAALLMGKDQAQLSRQAVSGLLTLVDLSKLGDEYWRNVADALRARFELLDRAELVAQGERHMERARWFFAKAAQR
jgi:hypothetical protein